MANIINADSHPRKLDRARTPRAMELRKKYKDFTKWLLEIRRTNDNTVYNYLQGIQHYVELFGNLHISESRLLKFKDHMERKYAVKTAASRIGAINMYLRFIKSECEPLKCPTIQRTFLENVISLKEYHYLCDRLKQDGDMRMYFIFRTLGATGVRAQELVMFQFDHVLDGHVDIRSKKKKVRRIYFPKKLRDEVQEYVDSGEVDRFDYICRVVKKAKNKRYYQGTISSMGTAAFSKLFKTTAMKYGMDIDVMYPHSFRHMFAKAFIAKHKDIALLADLLGHDNIETTRIYLRQTSEEQAAIVDEIVTW